MRRTLPSALLAIALPSLTAAQVLDVRELNTEQIRGLDRAKTAAILVGGILEEHGPYLPAYIDGYDNERYARDLAEAIAARPGWAAVLFPTIPLGQGGANIIGGKHSFPGSFTVRTSTLRAVHMDLADALGERGFRWVFVVDGHGFPNHNRALDDASAYFRDTFGGMMVHLYGLMQLRACCQGPLARLLSEAERREEGFTVHAGADETSGLLFLRPQLVDPGYRRAPAVTGRDFPDLVRLARREEWPGYFGSPRLASAALGAQQYKERSPLLVSLALKILDGWDDRAEPRYAQAMQSVPGVAEVVQAADEDDNRRETRQREWLAKRARP
jgi:creatinine amidohydrolase